MKYIVILFFSLALLSNAAYAQGKYKKHQVAKGETVIDIAKKYKVTPYDIYRLNPDSQNGIQENAILLIPTGATSKIVSEPVKEKTTKIANPIHEVQPKETLYSLSKQYDVSIDDLKKANPVLADGLQIGQKIIIPVKGSGVEAQAEIAEKQENKKDAPTYLYHTVEAGETKYSIAKQYGMSLQLLEELNPEVKETLPLGYKLKLDKNSLIAKEIEPGAQPKAPVDNDYMLYTVQPKETFYSLSRRTGLTQEQIVKLNPEAKDGLKEGMELKLPKGTNTVPVADVKLAKLTATLKKSDAKKIALLLPFNINAEQTEDEERERIKNDRFLNMTLDFYAGALVAIDSARSLGLPVNVKILDSRESKNSSAIESLKGGLMNMDAVVGPFFQNNVERTAQTLTPVPVVSPLSKEAGKPMVNLYQSIPTTDMVRMAMLDYLKAQNGNVIAVVDAKKVSSKQFIRNNFPSARFADGAVSEDLLKSLLVKDKANFVLLETESTGMVSNTVRILAKLLEEGYQIQLAVLEKTEVLDHDEVPLSRLTALRMLYPSVTNDSETEESILFGKMFKDKNGVFPNQYASRGFDVTFDVILRLFQEKDFEDTMKNIASEQSENKFIYRNMNGGNYNAGVYILYYDEDLSIKQAQ